MDESGIFVVVGNNNEMGTQTNSANNTSTVLSAEIEKLSNFMSIDYESCEELEDRCAGLVSRKNSLEDEIEGYKGEIRSLRSSTSSEAEKMTQLERLEFSLRNQLKEWEAKYEALHGRNEALLEEKCELEEAENDSRLNAQRWVSIAAFKEETCRETSK